MKLRIAFVTLFIGLVCSQECFVSDVYTNDEEYKTETEKALHTANCERIVFQNITGDLDTSILYSVPTNITDLEISNSFIVFISLCSYQNLRKIAIVDNVVFPELNERITPRCDNIAVLELSGVSLHPSALRNMHRLQVLDLRNMKIDELTREYTRPLHDLQFLRIVNSEIRSIQPEVLCSHNLRRLNLKGNRVFPNITISILDSCLSLESFVLYGNYNLHEDSFNTMINLQKLYIVETKITYLSENYFRALSKLVLLNLEENGIKRVHENAFESLINLEMLNLKYSELEIIPPGLFRNQEKLAVLTLTGNRIKTLHEIKNLPSLKMLDVSWNLITEIDAAEVEENLPSLNQLLIFGNNMSCDNMRLLKYDLQKSERKISLSVSVLETSTSCF